MTASTGAVSRACRCMIYLPPNLHDDTLLLSDECDRLRAQELEESTEEVLNRHGWRTMPYGRTVYVGP